MARLVAVGMSNRQVASELFVSIKTVQFHLTHIYAKLGVARGPSSPPSSATTRPPTTPASRRQGADEGNPEDGTPAEKRGGAPTRKVGARRRDERIR